MLKTATGLKPQPTILRSRNIEVSFCDSLMQWWGIQSNRHAAANEVLLK
jgi:hypothetical protein